MTATTYIRCIDDQPVEAMQYTGGNLAALGAWVGPGFHVIDGDPPRIYVSRDAEGRGDQAYVGDWIIRDDERVYAVRSYAFRGDCREAPIM